MNKTFTSLAVVLLLACAAFADVLSTANVHAPASNTAAVVTYAAAANTRHAVNGIAWSYAGGTPTGGNLKIENGAGTVVFNMDITSDGAGFIPFPQPRQGTANTALTVTLAAGGAGVSGKVNVLYYGTQ